MKKCPLCEMTVRADKTCPICQTTLTYEPEIPGRFEKKKLNKYLLFYFLKRFAFVLGAISFCVIAGLFIQMESYWLATAVTASLALIITTFQRILTMYIKIPFFESLVWLIIYLIKYIGVLLPTVWGILYLIFN